MEEADLFLGELGDDNDICYLTGFRALGSFVCLKNGDSIFLVVSILEKGRAAAQAPGAQVLTPAELSIPKDKRCRLNAWILFLLRREKIKAVNVSRHFPAAIADYLRKCGVSVRICQGLLLPQRAVKSAAEITNLRAAQKAAVAAMREVVATIQSTTTNRQGFLCSAGRTLTSEELRAKIDRVLLTHNCLAEGTVVAGGLHAANPHAVGSGPLKQSEPIVIDIFPKNKTTGYWGDITRTVIKGQPTPAIKKLVQTVRKAQEMALNMVKPGVAVKEIHLGVENFFKAQGFATGSKNGIPFGFIHSTGHGVGLDIHESPWVGNCQGVLTAGNVITIEPGLYYPDLGGARIEDTILVTEDGWKYLCPCPKGPFLT